MRKFLSFSHAHDPQCTILIDLNDSLVQQLDDEILQKIAKEMNLSETAFVLEKNDQDTYEKGQKVSASVFI